MTRCPPHKVPECPVPGPTETGAQKVAAKRSLPTLLGAGCLSFLQEQPPGRQFKEPFPSSSQSEWPAICRD